MKAVAIVGASVGGLVAAAELREQGFSVTVFEAGRTVAGMYGRVETPFGIQEMGMHVLYLTEAHYAHLSAIFGADAFHTWSGPSVDLAANRNFGRNFFGSVYPDVRGLPSLSTIRDQVLAGSANGYRPAHALEAVVSRFGEEAGRQVYAPILKKLWKADAELLTKDAIHCFYDLRRIVLLDKEEADCVKADPWFDLVVANPVQTQPRSEVFGGRMAARFKNLGGDPGRRIDAWLARTGVRLELGKPALVRDGRLMVGDMPLDEQFHACIVATPAPTLMHGVLPTMDLLELSIYYFRLAECLGDHFPAYYLLLHEHHLLSSRIVNYDAYNIEDGASRPSVLAVEVAHPLGQRPSPSAIAAEVQEVFPMAVIAESYAFPGRLKTPVPSLRNARLIDEGTVGLEALYEANALYFTGMRTDQGIFFSHHTVGLAYESALDCTRRLA